jgi:hypothetical protein
VGIFNWYYVSLSSPLQVLWPSGVHLESRGLACYATMTRANIVGYVFVRTRLAINIKCLSRCMTEGWLFGFGVLVLDAFWLPCEGESRPTKAQKLNA